MPEVTAARTRVLRFAADGTETLTLPKTDVIAAEAQRNYVTVHAARGSRRTRHLLRTSLSALVDRLGAHRDIWLDGGHNPHAGLALARFFDDRFAKVPRGRPTMIVGMLTTKDPAPWFAAFADLAPRILAVPVETSDAGFAPADLATLARAQGLDADAFESLDAAIEKAATSEGPVIIAGSLYVAGDALDANGTPPD